MKPKKFTKKPVTIEAMQWDGTGDGSIPVTAWALSHGWVILYDCLARDFGAKPVPHLNIETLEGFMKATAGDWIIRGVAGEFYPCKSDIFAATYEEVSE